MYLKF